MKIKYNDIITLLFGFILGSLFAMLIALTIMPNKYDVNGDGKVNASDYVLIKNYIMEGD